MLIICTIYMTYIIYNIKRKMLKIMHNYLSYTLYINILTIIKLKYTYIYNIISITTALQFALT